MTMVNRLRALLAAPAPVVAPGVYDGLSARLAAAAGFAALYASGGAIARSTGVPDLGLLGVGEIAERVAQIVDATGLPVIADADNGHGNALNTRVTVRALARAGAAGWHLEDQALPKRCGHLDDKTLVPVAEFTQKLRAAKDAAPEPVLIARTDAIAVEGLDRAIARAHAYAEAGADMVFVEAPESEAEIERIAAELPYPKLINMFQGGKTPLVALPRLAALGFRVVIVPSDAQRAAIHAMQAVFAALAADGTSAAVQDRMASFRERERIVDTAGWLALDRRFADSG